MWGQWKLGDNKNGKTMKWETIKITKKKGNENRKKVRKCEEKWWEEKRMGNRY